MDDTHENPSGFSVKKKVDESWKDNVEKEKDFTGPNTESLSDIKPSFASFVTTLGMQAFVALGEFQGSASPEAEAPQVDLAQAKSLIDILQILSEKTKGNLTEEEAAMFQEILYGLKMKFVEKSGKL